LKSKLIYNCIPIAIEKHLIVSRLKQAMYRFIESSIRYAIYYEGPTIVTMPFVGYFFSLKKNQAFHRAFIFLC